MQAAGGARAVGRRASAVLLAAAAVVLALDQATKAIALAALEEGESIPAIDGVLHWTLQRNPGAAFGLFQRLPVLFTVLAIGVSAVILWIVPRVGDRALATAYGLILGGALGNLGDRLFRPPGPFRGHVIDFVDLRVWPTFNVADSAIVTGALLAALLSLRRATPHAAEDGGAPGDDAGPASG